jgi:transcriptional regulator with XRE-family HTH domain
MNGCTVELMPRLEQSVIQIVAENTRSLIESTGHSSPEIAVRSGLDRKTLNNVINERRNVRIESVAAIANAFGLEAWQLLIPNLGAQAYRRDILNLIRDFIESDDDGRHSIVEVARIASRASHRFPAAVKPLNR